MREFQLTVVTLYSKQLDELRPNCVLVGKCDLRPRTACSVSIRIHFLIGGKCEGTLCCLSVMNDTQLKAKHRGLIPPLDTKLLSNGDIPNMFTKT